MLEFLRVNMTDYRRQKLGEFGLNMAVVGAGVAMFDGKYWGILPAIAGLVAFFILSREK